MSLFLTKSEVDDYRTEIAEAFDSLITHPWLSVRKNSQQWAFLRHCFKVLMGQASGDFPCSEKQAVQYKYEISDRFQRYYLAFGKPVKFVFQLVSEKKNSRSAAEEPDYPSSNSYRLMVSYNYDRPEEIQLRKLLAEKAIAEAVEAEFNSYLRLPEIVSKDIENVFDQTGSRYKEIMNLLRKHRARGWTLRNESNPSTKRLIDLKIVKMTKADAEVRTLEFWLLMWWSLKDEKYAHTYKEENRQTYHLIWKQDRWLVRDNTWPKPKISTPRRNIRAR